jgi:hypothetical protein
VKSPPLQLSRQREVAERERLVGLGANVHFGLWWIDPVTAFLIAGVAVKEDRG